MNSSVLVELYHYPDDSNTDVIVVGKTSASYIPLSDVTSTSIQVLVTTVTDRAVNPSSENFTTTECNTRELNPTTTITITRDTTFVTLTTTTATSTVPIVTGIYVCTYVYV